MKILQLDTRRKIFFAIKNKPGISLRKLQRETNLAIGQLTYHLSMLKKYNIIKTIKEKRFTRYYPIGLDEKERKILSVLRMPTKLKIMLYLLENNKLTTQQLSRKLSLSPATISWNMQYLKDKNLIESQIKGNKKYYSLKEKPDIIKTIIKYKKSFVENLSDNFIKMWEI